MAFFQGEDLQAAPKLRLCIQYHHAALQVEHTHTHTHTHTHSHTPGAQGTTSMAGVSPGWGHPRAHLGKGLLLSSLQWWLEEFMSFGVLGWGPQLLAEFLVMGPIKVGKGARWQVQPQVMEPGMGLPAHGLCHILLVADKHRPCPDQGASGAIQGHKCKKERSTGVTCSLFTTKAAECGGKGRLRSRIRTIQWDTVTMCFRLNVKCN